jgi:D-hexose-6-phosphate mutarotase
MCPIHANKKVHFPSIPLSFLDQSVHAFQSAHCDTNLRTSIHTYMYITEQHASLRGLHLHTSENKEQRNLLWLSAISVD